MTHLLEINNLDVKFDTDEGRITAIDNVSLTLDQGKVFPANLRDSSAFRTEIQKSYKLLQQYGSLSSIKKLLSVAEK